MRRHQYGIIFAGIFAFGFFYYFVEGGQGRKVIKAIKDPSLRDPGDTYLA
jgi:hypothetical protein